MSEPYDIETLMALLHGAVIHEIEEGGFTEKLFDKCWEEYSGRIIELHKKRIASYVKYNSALKELIKDTIDHIAALEARNKKLMEAGREHLEKCKSIEPRLWVYFKFGKFKAALDAAEGEG